MAIAHIDVQPYSLPFVRPVQTAAGSFTHRDGWILKITRDDGFVGYGDCAPWPGFGSGVEKVRADIGGDLQASQAIEIRGALATAMADADARRRNIPLARYLAPEARLSVATHKIVSDATEAAAAVRLGYRVLKIKVGAQTVEHDVKRIAAVREAAGKHVRLRLDANGGWSVADAITALNAMADFGIDLVEQPVATIDELREVRSRCRLRIAADECVTDAASLEHIAKTQAVDVVVLKPAFLGGVVATRDLIKAATAEGLHCIVTHALESAVGRAAAIHLACALPDAPVCGLASSLARDIAQLPDPVESRLAHPRGAGLGVIPLEQT
jgi:o-succinylbenzoate synthase